VLRFAQGTEAEGIHSIFGTNEVSMTTAVILLAGWFLATGLTAVYFEVETVNCGARVQGLLKERDALIDEVRRKELKYNELLSPDVLERDLSEEFRTYEYPIASVPEEPTDLLTAE